MKEKILEFCRIVRESFPQSQMIYTQGSCYKFHEMLKFIFPNTTPYNYLGHVISKIGNNYFDVTGEIKPTKEIYCLYNEPLILIKYKNLIFDTDEFYNPKEERKIKIKKGKIKK